MKNLLASFLFFVFCYSVAAQIRETYVPNTFNSPEPKFILPTVELPEHIVQFNPITYGKIKRKNDNGRISKYDIQGNIISDSINYYEGIKVAHYAYEKGKLISYSNLFTPDKKELERQKRSNQIDAENQIRETGSAMIAEMDSNQTETTYTAKLNNNGQIESYFWKYNVKDGKKYGGKNYEVKYDKNKISAINSFDIVEKLFYQSDFLIKKEITNSLYKNRETLHYYYTTAGNLHYITTESNYDNSKINSRIVLKDSVAYDAQNRIVWHGLKTNYSTYSYDKKNRLIEETKYLSKNLYSKNQFEYTNDNITKMVQKTYDVKGKEFGTITEYLYVKNKLSEIKTEVLNLDINTKKKYEYDGENRLILIKKLDYKRANLSTSDEKYSIEMTLKYDKKTVIINNNYSTDRYDFY
ncbi:MAG: hypothetical protein WCJ62_03010 [Flavobacterium sp.]